jgi:hypothetical protein
MGLQHEFRLTWVSNQSIAIASFGALEEPAFFIFGGG